jgi:hypothetical protein
MKNAIIGNVARPVVVGLALLVTVWGASSLVMSRLSALPEQSSETDTHKRQRKAMKDGGLVAAAAISGSYVTSLNVGVVGGPAYLEELASLTSDIVVGSTDDNVCRLTADGKSIETIYTVRVETATKGLIQPGAVIAVAVPGGKVSLPGNRWAQVNTPGFLEPMSGHRYVWFLNQSSTDPARFELSQGPLGLYDLAPRSKYVAPSGSAKSMLAQNLTKRHLTPDQFVNALKTLRIP